MAEQNFKNHVRLVPTFHFFVLPVLVLNFVQSIFRLVHSGFRWNEIVGVLTALALIFLALHARLFALRVQDRVIRLEERLRLMQLLSEPMRARIPELTVDQLCGLRFASDAELPKLAERALNEKLSRKQIKEAIQNWRPDYWRV